jgi:hypothetical protein
MTISKTPRRSAPKKPASKAALAAEELLGKRLVRIGSDKVHYVRCFRTASGKQLALNRTNAGIDIWTEPVLELAPASFSSMRTRRYSAEAPRISSLLGNAPNLDRGNPVDYWRFPTHGDLSAFIDWYKTL